MLLAAETRLGRRATPSLGTSIKIFRERPVDASYTFSSPFSSYTMRLLESDAGQRTSHVFSRVTCVVFLDSRSYR